MKACTTDASPAKSPSTIFLAVKGGFAPRFLLRTEIVPTLCRAGVCVILLTPNTDEPYFVSEFKRDGVFIEPLRIEAYERYL